MPYTEQSNTDAGSGRPGPVREPQARMTHKLLAFHFASQIFPESTTVPRSLGLAAMHIRERMTRPDARGRSHS